MRIFRSFAIAFSMYSRVPMPNVKWENSSMAYAMCFFPLVGAVSGTLMFALLTLCGIFNASVFVTAALAVLLPVAYSGAIHLDGFCDTADALASRAEREKKLAILKDPNIGAFAVICCILYFLLYFVLFTELDTSSITNRLVVAFIPVLSRSLSGLSVVCFRNARNNGLLAAFSQSADKRIVRTVLALWLLVACAALLVTEVYAGIRVIAAATLMFLYYRVQSYRQFGGVTGDLAGWFLQICELLCLAALLL